MNDDVIWVADYARVSSDLQKEKDTIQNQRVALERFLRDHPEFHLYHHYEDNGFSGSLPLAERPGGASMLRDGAAGHFSQIIVTKADRLGRDKIDLLVVRRRLQELGIKLTAVMENLDDTLGYDIRAILADHERLQILERSAAGMERAAREGRYCGGIVRLGYMVDGKKPHARLVPSDAPMWGDLTEADVLRRFYHRSGVDGWSCRRIANECNTLGIPTVYQKDGRGIRGKRTQGLWTAGHIRNLLVQPVYRGELQYGRRSKAPREIISAEVQPLVSEELWNAAQATLAANRIMSKNVKHTYLLKGVIRCSNCGLHYCGSWSRDRSRYRCDGGLISRRPYAPPCNGLSFYGDKLERIVWADFDRWLRDPGDGLLEELAQERNNGAAAAQIDAERATLEAALAQRQLERDRLLDAYQAGAIPLPDLKPRLDENARQREGIEEKLRALEPQEPVEEPVIDRDWLAELRKRVDELDDDQKQKVVALLAGIVVTTEMAEDGSKKATAVVTYRFPEVVTPCRGRGSWPPPA
jgi:site-specific DNA recombinase